MTRDLAATARALVAAGKGLLAIDESSPTIEKRFKTIGIPSTEPNRRAYRELLVTAPGLGQFISGAILFDETIRQTTRDGLSFAAALQRAGILPGIKVDGGAKPLAGFPDEEITEGLDGLRERLAEYVSLGAVFTKWRAVISVAADRPTDGCLRANAQALARFAALSQEAGLVPIVEPEVLMDGTHPIERHFAASVATLHRVFAALHDQRVQLDRMLLKTNMVLAGKEHAPAASPEAVADATLRCLRLTVPPAVPGIVFLSGGQEDVEATRNLDALNRRGTQAWELSFSYGRALQAPALKTWKGDPAEVAAAQRALLHRARCNSAARSGRYTERDEAAALSR